MINQKNTTLAFDILRAEKRHTAFIVAFAVVIVDRMEGKGGSDHEEN